MAPLGRSVRGAHPVPTGARIRPFTRGVPQNVEADPGHRGRRLPRLAPVRASARDGHEVLCVDNFFTGRRGNVAHLLDHPRFELMRHDVTFPLYVEVDEIYNLACPASPIHYQRDPVQTTKTSVHGAINMLGLAKRARRRSSRPRPARSTATRDPSADGRVLGQRQPDRPAVLLRRRQALRRDAVLRLPPPARAGDQGGAHLQHLWPAHASQRRPGGVELHRAGAAGRADHASMATAARRVRSAMSTIWSRASSG